MDLRLRNRVAVVTGAAAGGLGAAIVRGLCEEGVRVVAADRDADRNAALVAECGDAVRGLVHDVADPEFADAAVGLAEREFGRLDVLVNAAAIYPSRPWDEYDLGEWDTVLGTNLRPLFGLARAAAPALRRSGAGAIVNIGSITVNVAAPNLLPYVTAKAGIVGLTRALARELGPDGVRVNCVAPGAFPTGGETIHPDPEGYARHVIEQQSLKRRGRPDELADVVTYLASDRASFITGQTIVVDGGWAFQ